MPYGIRFIDGSEAISHYGIKGRSGRKKGFIWGKSSDEDKKHTLPKKQTAGEFIESVKRQNRHGATFTAAKVRNAKTKYPKRFHSGEMFETNEYQDNKKYNGNVPASLRTKRRSGVVRDAGAYAWATHDKTKKRGK